MSKIHPLKALPILGLSILTSCASLHFSPQKPAPHPLPKLKKVNVALVLGGGGAKGLAEIGVIEELEKAGIKPDVIIGCSAGSIVGAMYADGYRPEEIKNILLHTKSNSLLKLSLNGFPFSLYSNFKFKQFLNQNLHNKDFKSLKIPFIAVTTDLKTGQLVPLSNGQLVPAVMASSAYPGAFFPVKINGSYYVDGGVSNPVPVSIAKQLNAKFIIAVDISGKLNEKEPNHFFGLLKRSLEIIYLNYSKSATDGADVIITMPFKDVETFSDSQNQYVYRTGVEEAKKAMPSLIKKYSKVAK